MAGRAVNVVPLLPAGEQFMQLRRVLRGKRQFIPQVYTVVPSGQEIAVGIELPGINVRIIQTRNCSSHGIARSAAIREKVAGPQGNELGLIVHVLAAAGKYQPQNKNYAESQPDRTDWRRFSNTAPP